MPCMAFNGVLLLLLACSTGSLGLEAGLPEPAGFSNSDLVVRRIAEDARVGVLQAVVHLFGPVESLDSSQPRQRSAAGWSPRLLASRGVDPRVASTVPAGQVQRILHAVLCKTARTASFCQSVHTDCKFGLQSVCNACNLNCKEFF
jgi:hypothetical protein